jgi:hypothetical protein
MSFVPVIPPQEQASPRAQELSRRIAETIESFRREHPDLKPREIRQASRLALRGAGTGKEQQINVILALLLVLLGLGALFVIKSGAGESTVPILAIAAIILVLAVVLKIRRA